MHITLTLYMDGRILIKKFHSTKEAIEYLIEIEQTFSTVARYDEELGIITHVIK